MGRRRFQVENLAAPVIRVSGDQARHALRVLRMKVGDEVTLFDGCGDEVSATITSTDSAEFEAKVVERKNTAGRMGPSLAMAVAMPKGPRGDWLVEKCAELGVSRLWPLACERGQVEPGQGKLTRWRRKTVEAAKQSAQATMMAIENVASLADALSATGSAARIYYGALHGRPRSFADELRSVESRTAVDAPLLFLIGPEGGFTDDERRRIETAGGSAVSLAPTILRIETAAVAAAATWAGWAVSLRAKAGASGSDVLMDPG